jgi:hypothetical protein
MSRAKWPKPSCGAGRGAALARNSRRYSTTSTAAVAAMKAQAEKNQATAAKLM